MSNLHVDTTVKTPQTNQGHTQELPTEGRLPDSGKSIEVLDTGSQATTPKGLLSIPLKDEDVAAIHQENLKQLDAVPTKEKEKIDVSGLTNPDVRKAAKEIAERLGKLQSGVQQGQGEGLKMFGGLNVKAELERLFELADTHNDPQMLNTLRDAISFEGKKSLFQMTTADGRARARAAQLFNALQGDGTYQTLKQNIMNLPRDAQSLRQMARDPNLMQGLDQTKYADVHKLLKAVDGSDYQVQEHHREWHLDQAGLMEAYSKCTDNATKKKLALVMLHSFGKAAPLGQASEALELQSTPFFNANQYYRSTAGNKLLHDFRTDLAQNLDMAQNQNDLHLLDNSRFREILARAYPFPGVNTQPSNQYEFEDGITKVFAKFADSQFKKAGFPPLMMEFGHEEVTQPIVFDVTRMYSGQNLSPKELHTKMAELEKVFLDRAELYLNNNPNVDRKAFAEKLMRNFRVGALTTGSGIDLLVTPPFLSKGSDNARFTPGQNKLLEAAKVQVGSTPPKGSNFNELIKHTIIETGYRPDMIRAKELWLGVKSPEEILEKQGIKITELATSSKPFPKVVDSFKVFTEQPLYQKFAALENDPNAKPFLKVMPGSTTDLLNGLLKYQAKSGGIDKVFEDKGLTDLLQMSYFRMANAMQSVIHNKDDLVSVCNGVETINQELAMILSIVEPNGPGMFSDGIRQAMVTVDDKNPKTIPMGIDQPLVHLKPSSMHCLASIASSIEAQKGSNNLNVCVLKDNYYEGVGALRNANTYKMTILDGDALGDKSNPQALDKTPFQGKTPLDLFVCDFHHNISIDRQHYKVEDLQRQVDELYSNNLVAPKFTVALDCTIDFINSPDVQAFLEHNKDRITKGELNVVLYRSAQKFDMFGLDNYYGGFTVTLNKHADYPNFNARMDAPDDQLTGLARQGLTHVGVNAAPRMDQYRQALMENTKKLYDALPQECIYSPTATSPIQVSKTDDPNAVFLDIKFPGNEKAFGEFDKKIRAFAKEAGLPLTERASFGFVTTNYNFIAGSKCRMTPGLEGPEVQQQYIAFFKAVTMCVNDAKTAGEKQGLTGDPLNDHIAEALRKMPMPTATTTGPQTVPQTGPQTVPQVTTPSTGPITTPSSQSTQPNLQPITTPTTNVPTSPSTTPSTFKQEVAFTNSTTLHRRGVCESATALWLERVQQQGVAHANTLTPTECDVMQGLVEQGHWTFMADLLPMLGTGAQLNTDVQHTELYVVEKGGIASREEVMAQLESLQEGQFYYMQCSNTGGNGHAMVIYREADALNFFDPNVGSYRSGTNDLGRGQLADRILQSSRIFNDVALLAGQLGT